MPYRLLAIPAKAVMESIIDNYIRDNVKPQEGSLLYCKLAFGFIEHSGIYIGDNKIVHLDGSGKVQVVSPSEFINRLEGTNIAFTIWVSCIDNKAVGDKKISKRAKSQIGKERNYNLLSDNCHQFSAGCITGEFDNNYNYFYQLESLSRQFLNSNTFRVWNFDNKELSSIEKETIEYNVDKQLARVTSIILMYCLKRENILPIDILYFDIIIQKKFNLDNIKIFLHIYKSEVAITKNELINALENNIDNSNRKIILLLIINFINDDIQYNCNKFLDIRELLQKYL